jgi:hypothetical protein
MYLVHFLLRRFFAILIGSASDSLPNHDMKLYIRRQEHSRFRVPKKYSRDFEFVEPEPEVEQVGKGEKYFILA